MGLFFEKASKQSKVQRLLTNAIIVLLIINFVNTFFVKLEWLKSIAFLINYFLLAFVFIWLVFFVKQKGKDRERE